MLVGGAAALVALAPACIADLPADPPPQQTPLVSPTCSNGYIDLALGEQCDPGVIKADADLGGCTSQCQMQCPSGFVWAGNNHCYRVAPVSAATLDMEATDRCAAMSAHVVTFASEAEYQAVAGHLGIPSFWVGLEPTKPPYASAVEYEPGWATTCSGCYAHTSDPDADLPRAVAAGTSDAGAVVAEDCVEALANVAEHDWRQYPCTGGPALRVVCENEPVGIQSQPCEAGVCISLAGTFPAKEYVYVDQPATADAAETGCRSMGGRLVVLGSRDEREQLWSELAKLTFAPPPTAVWIGLAVVNPEAGAGAPAAWGWDDGTDAEGPGAHPSPWGDREPLGTGAITSRAYLEHFATPPLDDTLARNDGPETPLPFVCELVTAQGDAGQ